MIKIDRIDPPEKLTPNEVERLTNIFKKEDKNVWGKKYIKEQLLLMSNNKCAYCETSLNVSGSYMEVEHFFPKSIYPDKVVEWDNLLPSCKRCNGTKGSEDPNIFCIINPTVDDPTEHLALNRYRIVGKDELGKNTVSILNLNDFTDLVMARARVGETLSEKLEEIADDAKVALENPNLSKTFKIRNSTLSLLKKVQPQNAHSATLASILLSDPSYLVIKDYLMKEGQWNEELNGLELVAKRIRLSL
ncbi:HNH endonuclease [Enterococcus durans]|uniref:HNH endonuclease n=1 Tax=Enterococcus durans TaxID=53345 RepID=UPI002073E2AA|nr:HNH endonuclease [Enterococcus durans]MCM6856360.1 HNH endonuclease [Enterococcus durans]